MKKDIIVAAIQARMGSTRLPKKVLREIMGRPIIWHIYHRLRGAKLLDRVVVATAATSENQAIVEFCKKEGIDFYAGSESDLVDRLYRSAAKFNATALVRVTADCPLVDPSIVDMIVGSFLEGGYDYVSNWSPEKRTFPHGLEVDLYSFKCLSHLTENVKSPLLREWIPMNIHENPKDFTVKIIQNDADLSNLRLTVDYEEDVELIERIFEGLYSGRKHIFGMAAVREFLAMHPDLLHLNEKYIVKKGIEDYLDTRREA